MKEEISFTQVPFDYPLCLNGQCPKAATCLRQLAMQSMPTEKDYWKIISPKRLATVKGECPFYRSSQKARYAKGFMNMLNYLNAQIRHRRAEQDMHSTLTRRLQADVRSLSACDPDLLFSEEIRAILKQAVRKMPKMTRNVFLLSRIRNMTYSEIAAELGISVSHVNFEIRRALNLMRFELKDYLPAVLITLILSSRW